MAVAVAVAVAVALAMAVAVAMALAVAVAVAMAVAANKTLLSMDTLLLRFVLALSLVPPTNSCNTSCKPKGSTLRTGVWSGAEKHRGHEVPLLLLLVLQARRLRSTAGTRTQKLHSLVLQELAPVRRLPTIDDAPRPTACAPADVQVVSSRGLQAAMSYRHNRAAEKHRDAGPRPDAGRAVHPRCSVPWLQLSRGGVGGAAPATLRHER
eukprot:10574761-Lingulodinium_polyedra.AAC.1